MRHISLSRKILLATALILAFVFAASLTVFYVGQRNLTIKEMDRLLESESVTISTLVNISRNGDLDFEFSKQFLPQYENLKFTSFFRFYHFKEGRFIQQSPSAPDIRCNLSEPYHFEEKNGIRFRVYSYKFTPMAEINQTIPEGMVPPELCLVLGTDEAPYHQLVSNTLYATIPVLTAIFIFSLFILSTLIKSLTADLTSLARALSRTDFGATRSFPNLPKTNTVEVTAIVNQLETLHRQAAQVYEDMLLFLGRATHQLKTPAAAIQATLEVLVRRDRSKEELLAGLSDLGIGVAQMNRLTHKLIASTRVTFETMPQMLAIDLNDFFENQKKMFNYQADRKSIQWKIEYQQDSKVLGDETLLSEVFGNLIENAILYSDTGGHILIRWYRVNDIFKIQVADRGPGFPKAVLDSLFSPFVRGDERKVAGSGLGLSIVKKAVESMGGKVALTVSSSDGSLIEIILPSA
ncbi:MAG: HAMP domain-containing histidine kinase [Proteobacteria bacterium]|nr:MAG: HAMP domain-containing histidine kinase [Pseudomonadota bacterium]